MYNRVFFLNILFAVCLSFNLLSTEDLLPASEQCSENPFTPDKYLASINETIIGEEEASISDNARLRTPSGSVRKATGVRSMPSTSKRDTEKHEDSRIIRKISGKLKAAPQSGKDKTDVVVDADRALQLPPLPVIGELSAGGETGDGVSDRQSHEESVSPNRGTPQMGVNSLRNKPRHYRTPLASVEFGKNDGVGYDVEEGLYVIRDGKYIQSQKSSASVCTYAEDNRSQPPSYGNISNVGRRDLSLDLYGAQTNALYEQATSMERERFTREYSGSGRKERYPSAKEDLPPCYTSLQFPATIESSFDKPKSGTLAYFKKHKRSASGGVMGSSLSNDKSNFNTVARDDLNYVQKSENITYNEFQTLSIESRKSTRNSVTADRKFIGFLKSHNPFLGMLSPRDKIKIEERVAFSDPNSPCTDRRRHQSHSPVVLRNKTRLGLGEYRTSTLPPNCPTVYHLSGNRSDGVKGTYPLTQDAAVSSGQQANLLHTENLVIPRSAPTTPSKFLNRLSGEWSNRPRSGEYASRPLSGEFTTRQNSGLWASRPHSGDFTSMPHSGEFAARRVGQEFVTSGHVGDLRPLPQMESMENTAVIQDGQWRI